ncbi:MAG TPA: M14 family zinc carboxypeptidase [Gammaproteobacteria bacterium]|nr:M14 family zinc carboxypeptidase [Gammaproteobacteria bacterium]
MSRRIVPLLFLVSGFAWSAAALSADQPYARDPNQPADQAYTLKIRQFTTQPEFNSPLTDYLPASKTVPTPEAALGYIAGAPDHLPYSKDVYRYFRMLEKASPRVKVFSIGHTEEGREMIAVAVADEALLATLKENDARLAQLADPRTIGMNDAKAAKLVQASTPVYYITGTIHSTETGAPTALMELAYRLAVDDAPYIKYVRSHAITLITPIVEVDGRDRMVDIYNWHRAHPNGNWPPLMYWGHYVAHDNNRDAMGLTLNLTRNVLNTYLGWHAQVLHDLHESVPFLYDNTVGDGPYNAWIDPILANEWQQIGWDNVQRMTKFGMPGVFTHGDFDPWSPGYLMFIAAMHNGISRLYETFGNGGADTEQRILDPDEYSRTWYRQNPPLPKVLWSQRDNNNYEETGLLTALDYFAHNGQQFLTDFYLKSKRSIEKPQNAGPAAYVLTADEPRKGAQAALLRILQAQHCEIQRATAAFSVTLGNASGATDAQPKSSLRHFPAGSYIVRMDQPYSRIADALLDHQYWAPDDPQKHPYDDTGWTFGDLFDVDVARVTDSSILKTPMQKVTGSVQAPGAIHGEGSSYLIANHADNALISLRYRLRDADIDVTDAAFKQGNREFDPGSLIVHGVNRNKLGKAVSELGLDAYAVANTPDVAHHRIGVPRIAVMHTWLDTQTEGWWRMALDKLHVPYAYISTQDVSRTEDLRKKYDVILFGPIGYVSDQMIVNGLPMWGNPLPWKTTPLTPNIGRIDATDDIRPGLGFSGLAQLRQFIEQGGVLITSQDTARFAIDMGFAPGVSMANTHGSRVVGSVLRTDFVDAASPLAYGYADSPAVYSADGMAFTISNLTTGNRGLPDKKDYQRPTGRGDLDDPDVPQGRPYVAPEALPSVQPWQAVPLNVEQARNNPFVIPDSMRPRVILRFADSKDLLISGLLDNGSELAERPVVVDARYGKGHVILFGNNPIWRGETLGTYPLVFNAILNFKHLDPR